MLINLEDGQIDSTISAMEILIKHSWHNTSRGEAAKKIIESIKSQQRPMIPLTKTEMRRLALMKKHMPHQNQDLVREIKVDSFVIVCAFRYALGRMTYAVQEVANAIDMNKHLLLEKDRQLIIREITQAIIDGTAGMECDVAVWKRCRARLSGVKDAN